MGFYFKYFLSAFFINLNLHDSVRSFIRASLYLHSSHSGGVWKRGFVTSYIEVVRALMLLFFGVFLIQQSCVLLGLPVFLAGNYNPDTPWKLSSIAAEPSHVIGACCSFLQLP